MSAIVKTYLLYGTKVDVHKYDTTKFTDYLDYVDYLFDVVNRDGSTYRVILDEDKDDYYFGYIIDEAKCGSWDCTYLSTQTFDDVMEKVTSDIVEALDWMLLIHFNQRLEESNVKTRILTVYC